VFTSSMRFLKVLDPRRNSERFVVITGQLQAAKCSLSCQLFRHIFNFLHFNTVTLNVNKRLLDLSLLTGPMCQASFVKFTLVIT
jgi:hypothetical protein